MICVIDNIEKLQYYNYIFKVKRGIKLKVLAIGDLIGSSGIKKLKNELPKIIENEKIDFVIVNGENSAEVMGIKKRNF